MGFSLGLTVLLCFVSSFSCFLCELRTFLHLNYKFLFLNLQWGYIKTDLISCHYYCLYKKYKFSCVSHPTDNHLRESPEITHKNVTINTYANSTSIERQCGACVFASICNFHMFPRVVSTIFRDFLCWCVCLCVYDDEENFLPVYWWKPKKWVTLTTVTRDAFCSVSIRVCVCVCVYQLKLTRLFIFFLWSFLIDNFWFRYHSWYVLITLLMRKTFMYDFETWKMEWKVQLSHISLLWHSVLNTLEIRQKPKCRKLWILWCF